MLIDRRVVSRKTPVDGKLEISADAAVRLEPYGPEMPVRAAGHAGRARLTAMTCMCLKAGGAGHTHHFLESPVFRTLAEGEEVVLRLEGGAVVVGAR